MVVTCYTCNYDIMSFFRMIFYILNMDIPVFDVSKNDNYHIFCWNNAEFTCVIKS